MPEMIAKFLNVQLNQLLAQVVKYWSALRNDPSIKNLTSLKNVVSHNVQSRNTLNLQCPLSIGLYFCCYTC